MKITELRIGNLIYRKGGSEIFLDGRPEIKHPDIVVEVKTIFSDNGIDGVNASYNGDRYVFDPPLWNAKPIPLTEEWLVKFGWIKEAGWYHNPNSIFTHGAKFKKDGSLLSLHLPFFKINTSQCGKRQPLLFVHQLQNLYFDLTGEELIYNGHFNDGVVE